MMRLLFLLLIPAVLLSCKNQPDVAALDWIEVSKSRCMGPCKAYTIQIYSNRNVKFEGIDHVPMRGNYSGRLEQTTSDSLWGQVESTQLFSLDSVYGTRAEDSQRVRVTIEKGGKQKVITYTNGAPRALKQLVGTIEHIALNNAWQKQSSP